MTKLETLRTQIEKTPSREDLLWAVESLHTAMISLFILRATAENPKATRDDLADKIYKKLGHMLEKLGDVYPLTE